MIILISSAKTMTGISKQKVPLSSIPRFSKEASEIALYMSQYPVSELSLILKVSHRLGMENYHRFQDFHSDKYPAIPSAFAYTGVVYRNLNPAGFSEEDFMFAQKHLRFASVCYGLLRPLDLIKPYRMEYPVKLPELGEGNMYSFWSPRQTPVLLEDIRSDDGVLINLAAGDVKPSFNWRTLEESVRIITPEFKIRKNDTYKTIVIYTKMARGQMSRFIIKNRIRDPEELKHFSWEGFHFNEQLSDENNWRFTQE